MATLDDLTRSMKQKSPARSSTAPGFPAPTRVITPAIFLPDGKRIAVGTFAGSIHILDSDKATELHIFENRPDGNSVLAATPDGRYLLSEQGDDSEGNSQKLLADWQMP